MLRTGGGLYFEIYEQFGDQIAAMLEALGYHDTQVVKDIFGKLWRCLPEMLSL